MEKNIKEKLIETDFEGGNSSEFQSKQNEKTVEDPDKKICFEAIRVYELKDKEGKMSRTEIRSIKMGQKPWTTVINVLIGLFLYSICFFSETLYKDTLLDFSLSPDGIPWIQKDEVTSEAVKKFFLLMTKMGGGKEMVVWFIISFIFQRRAMAIYVCAVLALDKLINSYLKLLYANPRPYMVENSIQPIDCATSFGSPSGHASSSSMIATTLFLHVFHGYTHIENPLYCTREIYRSFYSYVTYFVSLLIAMFWFFGIPFSRYLMGVHSLDQLLFGNSLGVVGGFTMHFLVRDHLISNFDHLIDWQRKLGYIPCLNDEQAAELSKSWLDKNNQKVAEWKAQTFDHFKVAIVLIIYLLVFTYISIATFFRTDAIYYEGSKVSVIKGTTYDDIVKNWNSSKCKEHEGEWDMTYSLQNACLNACGYQWFLCGIYIFSAFRHEIWTGSRNIHTMDADSYLEFEGENKGWNTEENWLKVGVTKVLILVLLAGCCAPPAIFLKLKTFEAAGRYAGVIIMVTNIIIPGFVAAFLFVGGPFDAIMMKVLNCRSNETDKKHVSQTSQGESDQGATQSTQ